MNIYFEQEVQVKIVCMCTNPLADGWTSVCVQGGTEDKISTTKALYMSKQHRYILQMKHMASESGQLSSFFSVLSLNLFSSTLHWY